MPLIAVCRVDICCSIGVGASCGNSCETASVAASGVMAQLTLQFEHTHGWQSLAGPQTVIIARIISETRGDGQVQARAAARSVAALHSRRAVLGSWPALG